MAQQDDYYYEIQLTNKQLVFYFMAGATGLILSFLAGVMVGKGVEPSATDPGARVVQEERIVPEETPAPTPSPSDGLTYARRLESDRRDEALEAPGTTVPPRTQPPRPIGTTAPPRTTPAVTAPPAVATRPSPSPRVAAASPRPAASTAPAAGGQRFTIQVGAFKDAKAAEKTVSDLKARGLPAYTVPGANGLISVRVGHYASRDEAVTMKARVPGTPFVIPE